MEIHARIEDLRAQYAIAKRRCPMELLVVMEQHLYGPDRYRIGSHRRSSSANRGISVDAEIDRLARHERRTYSLPARRIWAALVDADVDMLATQVPIAFGNIITVADGVGTFRGRPCVVEWKTGYDGNYDRAAGTGRMTHSSLSHVVNRPKNRHWLQVWIRAAILERLWGMPVTGILICVTGRKVWGPYVSKPAWWTPSVMNQVMDMVHGPGP